MYVFGGFEGASLVWKEKPDFWEYQPPYIPRAPNPPDYYIAYLKNIEGNTILQESETVPPLFHPNGTIIAENVRIIGDESFNDIDINKDLVLSDTELRIYYTILFN